MKGVCLLFKDSFFVSNDLLFFHLLHIGMVGNSLKIDRGCGIGVK